MNVEDVENKNTEGEGVEDFTEEKEIEDDVGELTQEDMERIKEENARLIKNDVEIKKDIAEEVEDFDDEELEESKGKLPTGFIKLDFKAIFDNVDLLKHSYFATLMVMCTFVWRSEDNPWLYKLYEDGYLPCSAGIEKIARLVHKEPGALRKDLKILEKKGWIRKIPFGKKFKYSVGYHNSHGERFYFEEIKK